ncbi:MAG: type I-D CRISPR-associated protein Cas5/Csc1 [Chloroflexota bacterium]
MVIMRCRLTLHDSLFYATREMGTLYETERYLHNYALAYALFNERLIRAPYFASGYRPNYAGDLAKLNDVGIYVTPARPLQWGYLLITWKMAQVTYYRKPERFGPRGNFPENYGRAKELAPESEFECFVISQQPVTLPRWIRMGKWASKVLVEASAPLKLNERSGSFISAIPLNPLDVPGQLATFDLVSMPPVSLVVNARIEGQYYELPDGIRIPAGMAYTFPEL